MPGLRFLFTTLQHVESEFYGRVGEGLRARGHDVFHVTYSRRAARMLQEAGIHAICLADRLARLDVDAATVEREVERIPRDYETSTLRDIYRTDHTCNGRPEAESVERTVRHVLAIEEIFDELAPDVVVPEIGNEMLRTVAHLVALRRAVPVLFLNYTIFPRPLRVTVDRPNARLLEGPAPPIDAAQRAEVERFAAEFIARDAPIRGYREARVTAHRARILIRHVTVKLLDDRDNPYLQPLHWLAGRVREVVAARAARRYYSGRRPGRRYVYFPLHVTDDYKIKRVIPHCMDQAAIIEQVARALPHGYDLVTKEHPMSVGRTRLALLRRLRRMGNVRVVSPRTSSHDLISGASAVVVISSTVGLEALLHRKAVLTLGEPFYSGFGATLDAVSFAEIRRLVPYVLEWHPDPDLVDRLLYAGIRSGRAGAPVLVDRSGENAELLAASIDEAARAAAAVPKVGASPLVPSK